MSQFILALDQGTTSSRSILFDHHGGIVAAAGSIVDRSSGQLPDFGCPFVSLVQMIVETFDPADLPEDLRATAAIKPGSK